MTIEATPPSLAALEAFEHGINRLAISADGTKYATSDVDMNVRVYDGQTEIYSRNFTTENEKIKPTERIRGMAFAKNGDILYVAAGERVSAIRLGDGTEAWFYVAPRSFGFLIISPIALDVSEDGDVAAAFDNGSVVVWDSAGNLKVRWGSDEAPRMMRFVPCDHRIVGTDGVSLGIWDPKCRKRKMRLVLTARVYAMDIHSSGSIVATRTLQDVVLWDIVQRDVVCIIPVEPSMPVLAFHPTEKSIAIGERDRVRLVDFEGNTVHSYDLDVASALSLAFTPNGKELLIGCTKNQVIRTPLPSGS